MPRKRQNRAMPRTKNAPLSSEALADRDDCSTIEVAQILGMAVRSVQLMVDRGELAAWRTPGGHRRIDKASVQAWLARRGAVPQASAPPARAGTGSKVLLIEDSVHYQNLVSMLLARECPDTTLHIAPDGIVGLAMYGQLQPDLLLVDILLPGIDGATLITSLRSQPHFKGIQLVVITSLDEAQRVPYAFALQGVPVVHKPRLVLDLPPLLHGLLAAMETGA